MMYDPTYTGKSRKTLEPVSDNSSPGISFFSPPSLSVKSRSQQSGHHPRFADKHGIGFSRFDHKGSVLFANIDAVLNLTNHIGGYFSPSTQNDNMHFYSLFFEDRNLELHSYLQWRLPYSITRLVTSKSIGRPDLESINLDLVNFDIKSIMEGRPIDGYQLMGILTHYIPSLRSLTLLAMTMFSSMRVDNGKGFFVFPYGSSKNLQGRLSITSLTDFITLLSTLFTKVWLFRPYMCYSFICIGVESPKPYPDKESDEEKQILNIWDVIQQQSCGENGTESPIKRGGENLVRLFDAIDPQSSIPSKILQIVEAEEPQGRDRVEVLSRWQLVDQLSTRMYPLFKNLPTVVEEKKRKKH